MKQGATDYLLKDRLARLGEAVKQALRQKEAQEALRQSEARFSKIFHVSPVGIVISEFEHGHVLDVNESFLSMIGYERRDIIHHTIADFGISLTLANQHIFSESLRQSRTVRNVEQDFQTKSGELRQGPTSTKMIQSCNKTFLLPFLVYISY